MRLGSFFPRDKEYKRPRLCMELAASMQKISDLSFLAVWASIVGNASVASTDNPVEGRTYCGLLVELLVDALLCAILLIR